MAGQTFAHLHSSTVQVGDMTLNFNSRPVGSKNFGKALEVEDGVSNQEFVIDIDDDKVKSIVISTNVNVVMKVNENNADPIAITPNSPFIWKEGDQETPFGEDVTSLFFTNASGSKATIQIRIIEQ
jgi:hypothetical protein